VMDGGEVTYVAVVVGHLGHASLVMGVRRPLSRHLRACHVDGHPT